ncbi:hypothetical protein DB346_15345 [Verrucomicrobia bacterium LW23]|nr:hypothetical protein DB346_15345 [Verrucomicrobia bacterium LW23]
MPALVAATLSLLAAAAVLRAEPDGGERGIPVRFTLDKPGNVTLVINDGNDVRVRNLIQDTPFAAGEHTVYWDGLDDNPGKGAHAGGFYSLARQLVKPGTYTVRGIVHDPIDLRYQFSVYDGRGSPPWPTEDNKGGWLADHTAPQSALYLPGRGQIVIGSAVAEGGDGVVWIDTKGKKLRGIRYFGGIWTGAKSLARDVGGPKAIADIAFYAAANWIPTGSSRRANPPGEVRLVGFGDNEKTAIPVALVQGFESETAAEIGGMAARNGVVLASFPFSGKLMAWDVSKMTIKPSLLKHWDWDPANNAPLAGEWRIEDARGLSFDGQGNLLVLQSKRILRYRVADWRGVKELPNPEVLVDSGLESARQITTDGGSIYVADWGTSHQIKVFSEDGRPLRVIGHPGGPQIGKYDPLRMQNPYGLTVVDDRIWVTELSYLPKRVSVWSLDGRLIEDFIGPPQYGAGGEFDPRDKTRFYLADQNQGSMEFAVDWKTGQSRVSRILSRFPVSRNALLNDEQGGPVDAIPLAIRRGMSRYMSPQSTVYHGEHRYLTNLFSEMPVSLPSVVGIWLDDGERCRPVAAVGAAERFPDLFRPEFDRKWPEGAPVGQWDDQKTVLSYIQKHPVLAAWSDANADGLIQPDEIVVQPAKGGRRFYIGRDLEVVSEIGEAIRVKSYLPDGTPVYDLDGRRSVVAGDNAVSGEPFGMMVDSRERAVSINGPLSGYEKGRLKWTYPNQWPSLHSGHAAPEEQYPGQLRATTKPVSWPIPLADESLGELWFYNSDRGCIYAMTTQGYFVTRLFGTGGSGPSSRDPNRYLKGMLTAKGPGMDWNNMQIAGENFFPRVQRLDDGQVYAITGKHCAGIIRVNGIDSIRALPVSTLQVGPEQIQQAVAVQLQKAKADAAAATDGPLNVRISQTAGIVADGDLDDWGEMDWVDIQTPAKPGIRAAYIKASVRVDGDNLALAYRFLQQRRPGHNTGETPVALFKTGFGLDLMLGVDPAASAGRKAAAPGDTRLIVAPLSDDAHLAMLYKQVVPGTPDARKVPFSSPSRTITFDEVRDVSSLVSMATKRKTLQVPLPTGKSAQLSAIDYEVLVPLRELGLKPTPGLVCKGDIGVLLGERGTTLQRVYWHNKATGLVNDVPGEATLVPQMWGEWRFDAARR